MAQKPFGKPELLPGTPYLMVLRTLRGGPLHGYAIAKRMREPSGAGLEIEDDSLHLALTRTLVQARLVAEWGISENNRKARFYKLTPEWRQQLALGSEEFDHVAGAIQNGLRTA